MKTILCMMVRSFLLLSVSCFNPFTRSDSAVFATAITFPSPSFFSSNEKQTNFLSQSTDPLLAKFRSMSDMQRAGTGSVVGYIAGRTICGVASRALRTTSAIYLSSELVGYLSDVLAERKRRGIDDGSLDDVVEMAESALGKAKISLNTFKDDVVNAVRKTGRNIPVFAKQVAEDDPFFSAGFSAGFIFPLLM
uniref:Uncharacterized protein n=1 Tax=Corethron hystrix TaxID=216773 RepID=A0A7S1BIM1_9STRA|mmetsp:Transcript_29835/g.68457  ORF Transcript_29835/g.68457 Transcript_29835/m.68457 type:complete len:193 (+) Transcript_29835:42-620(+)